MRPFILLFLLAVSAQTQEHTTFRLYPQPVYVGSLTQYVVSICNTGAAPMNIHAAQVWAAAYSSGMQPATNENVLREADRVVGTSWQRKMLLFVEVSSYAAASSLVTDAVGKLNMDKPEGKATVASLLGFGLMLRVATTVSEKTAPQFTMPEQSKLLPNFFPLAAGQCVDYLMYGSPIR